MLKLRASTKLLRLAEVATLAAALTACDDAPSSTEPATPDTDSPAAQVASPLEYVVGTTRIEVDAPGGRKLPVQVWYPAVPEARAEADSGHPAYALEPAGPKRDKLKGLLEGGDPKCTNLTTHVAIDAPVAAAPTPLPLIVVSHHFAGTRLSTFTINERLAQRGFVVAAPDHVGGSLFDYDPANPTALITTLSPESLKTRTKDIASVIDVLTSPSAAGLPEGLRGRVDPERIGVYGHSFGAVTAGMLEASDVRIKAATYVAMVVSGPLPSLIFGTPAIGRFRVPALYLLAQEDKSVALAGGAAQVRQNFEQQTPPAWLVEVRDVGHFAIADDLAAIPVFADGCGVGTRVDRPMTSFTNLDGAVARDIAARYTTAFFAHQFLQGPAAALSEAVPAASVVTRKHD